MRQNVFFAPLLCLLLMTSCGNKEKGECPECSTETAKAILWIDWKYGEALDDYKLVRTAKARVNVYSDGTFRIISFCKSQKPEVVEYLKKRAAAYTIRKLFFEEGYIEPGEQYLQLRYLPEKISRLD